MACKKSELVSAINSYASARATNDGNLIAFSGRLVEECVNSLEYEPEEEAPTEGATEEQAE